MSGCWPPRAVSRRAPTSSCRFSSCCSRIQNSDIRGTADEKLNNIPVPALQAFLAKPDIPLDLREFFGDRGIFPDADVVIDFDKALIDTSEDDPEIEDESMDHESVTTKLQR